VIKAFFRLFLLGKNSYFEILNFTLNFLDWQAFFSENPGAGSGEALLIRDVEEFVIFKGQADGTPSGGVGLRGILLVCPDFGYADLRHQAVNIVGLTEPGLYFLPGKARLQLPFHHGRIQGIEVGFLSGEGRLLFRLFGGATV